MKNTMRFTFLTGLAGLMLLVILLAFAPGFAQTGEAILLTGIFIGIYAAFDKYVMKDIDTVAELKKGNIAYAIALAAIAIVFVAVSIIVG